MPTATVHIADVPGFAGPARCFRLDPPVMLGGLKREYVTVWMQYAMQAAIPGVDKVQFQTRPEVCLVPAEETGAAAPTSPGMPASLIRNPGSFVLHDDPDTPDRVEGAYWMALLMLGYQAEPVDAAK